MVFNIFHLDGTAYLSAQMFLPYLLNLVIFDLHLGLFLFFFRLLSSAYVMSLYSIKRSSSVSPFNLHLQLSCKLVSSIIHSQVV